MCALCYGVGVWGGGGGGGRVGEKGQWNIRNSDEHQHVYANGCIGAVLFAQAPMGLCAVLVCGRCVCVEGAEL